MSYKVAVVIFLALVGSVAPPFVGRGIGSRSLNHALSVLKPPIRLYTFQANVGARRFYERNDFYVIQLSDGRDNEEQCPDVLFERQTPYVVGA